MRYNRRVTVRELSQETGINAGNVEQIVHNELKTKKTAGFALLPPRQGSPSYRRFNIGDSTDTEVGCTASSTV
jgi:hypothetical protein